MTTKNEQIQPPEPNEQKALFAGDHARAYAKTAGEKIHNEITFRGVDWVVNTAVAVGFSLWASRTKFGRQNYSKSIDYTIGKFLEPWVKDTAKRKEMAEAGTGFVNIAVGGLAIVPALVKLEKNKQPIAEYFDRKIYGDERVENDPKFAMRYDAIRQEPQKNFVTGMAARSIVLAPMVYGHIRYNEAMTKHFYDHIGSYSKAAAKGLGIKPNAWLLEQPFNAKINNWDFIHRTIGMDLGLTFIYSFAHEAVYKGLTNWLHIGEKPAPAASLNAAPSSEVSAPDVKLKSLLQAPEHKAVAHG